MSESNNIFKYATKELTQDAFLCWSINWINEGENGPLYEYAKAILDLFLGVDKKEKYYDVQVYRQYEKIDVLVMFKDDNGSSHVLIIEDKTNTSEHGDQLKRYTKKLEDGLNYDESLKAYINAKIHLAYVKTGIMYDVDVRMVEQAVVVDLDMLLKVIKPIAELDISEILIYYYKYLQSIKDKRINIEEEIKNGNYEDSLSDRYGQFYFLSNIFSARSGYKEIGELYDGLEKNGIVYTDHIYAGTNRGGSPWIEYAFWKDKYPTNYTTQYVNEFHSLFWRVDCKWDKNEYRNRYYIALRHYDENAHSSKKYLNERKKFVYRKLRALADKYYKENPSLYEKIGVRENYKESDLLFIYIENIKDMGFEGIKKFLNDITEDFVKECDNLYDGMEEALKDYM